MKMDTVFGFAEAFECSSREGLCMLSLVFPLGLGASRDRERPRITEGAVLSLTRPTKLVERRWKTKDNVRGLF